MRPRRANCRLHMALRADRYKIPVADFPELDRRIQWLLFIVIAVVHGSYVPGGRAMAHFAINSRLAKLQILGREGSALDVAQLAGVAYRADLLITRRLIGVFPGSAI